MKKVLILVLALILLVGTAVIMKADNENIARRITNPRETAAYTFTIAGTANDTSDVYELRSYNSVDYYVTIPTAVDSTVGAVHVQISGDYNSLAPSSANWFTNADSVQLADTTYANRHQFKACAFASGFPRWIRWIVDGYTNNGTVAPPVVYIYAVFREQ